LVERLTDPPHDLRRPAFAQAGDALADDDLHLALYLCYELHYRGLAGVDERWEWEPSLLALRRDWETEFELALTEAIGPPRADATAG
jgi:hypothetical protein